MDWTKFSDSDLELELCDRYGAAADFSARGLMILALETTTRAVAAETARDSCYRAAAEVSGWLNTANKAVEVVSARAAKLDAELAAIRFAANMPDDYKHGLPSWVRQHLYASYIGASFSEAVLNQIREGRLTFPEAPIYKRVAELQTALDAERAAHRWRPVTEPPEEGQEVAIVIGARYWGEIEESDNKAGAPVGWYYTDDGDYFGPEFPKGWLPLCQEPQ
jgi:hypothetical protein